MIHPVASKPNLPDFTPNQSKDWELQEDLKNYISQSLCKHIPDNVLTETIMEDCPIPTNINPCKKLDSFPKELMEEQKKSYLRQIVTHTQLHIVGNMLGPLCKVWKHTESERNDILTLGEDEMAGKSYQ